MSSDRSVDGEHDDIIYPSAIPFVLVHLACFAAIWTGHHLAGRRDLRGALLAAHLRHRRGLSSLFLAPRLSRPAGCSSSFSRSSRRAPRRRACCGGRPSTGTITCIPTPSRTCIRRATRALSTAIVGWIFARQHDATDLVKVADLRALSRADVAAPIRAGAGRRAGACSAFWSAGWSGLVVGFFWSTVLVYHATFCINSLAHVRGTQALCDGRRFRATTGSWRSSPWAKAGTTTTTPIRAACGRASDGGRSIRPTTS